jgi:hypothetical protein
VCRTWKLFYCFYHFQYYCVSAEVRQWNLPCEGGLFVEVVQCVARCFIALSFCKTTCHWSLLLQVSALPRRLRSLRSGFTLHCTTRLFAAHRGAGRPNTLHVHHSCVGYCRIQAAQVQGQTNVFHYCKLTWDLPSAWTDLPASYFLSIQIVLLSWKR